MSTSLTEEEASAVLASVAEPVAQAVVEYEPVADTRAETLDAYVVLANTLQSLDLAANSEGTSATQVLSYMETVVANLDILEQWDPRFSTANALAHWGTERVGNFNFENISQLCEGIETWLPPRLVEPIDVPRYMVVDDTQSAEDFQATRQPDHEAVRVTMVSAEDAKDIEFQAIGRAVFPVPMYPDDALPNRAISHRDIAGMLLEVEFTTDRRDFPLLKVANDAVYKATAPESPYSSVEFYVAAAYAYQLARIAYSVRFTEDAVYRRKVLDELESALVSLVLCTGSYKAPRELVRHAIELNENLRIADSIQVSRCIVNWLPEDLTERIPGPSTMGNVDELCATVVAELNALPGDRLVAVYDSQDGMEFAATGLPDRDKLSPVLVHPEQFDPKLISPNLVSPAEMWERLTVRGMSLFKTDF
ncbi:hypothetical protein [Corynebacterium aquatimens]|uniref:Uncharacterized protein n=1 Tax=Corynebacterium aquatimens TaxID=1190508 RepID=A0A931E3X1_9CORY|nr:hypothetical protein [Corynebacterium aquatimens]MBG6122681.1 hypothetical protein [Corynebacterium aquatimens]